LGTCQDVVVPMLFLPLLLLAGSTNIKVTLNVFSGRPDPEWIVNASATDDLLLKFGSVITKLPLTEETYYTRPIPWYRLGYRGFELSFDNSSHVVALYNMPDLELFLLRTNGGIVNSQVVEMVIEEIKRFKNTTNSDVQRLHGNVDSGCTAPVKGPDSSTVYNPATDACGFFVTYQTKNNCYNYGCDIATNTFAQPGQASGHRYTAMTCDNVKAAATSDGLRWVGTTTPTSQPAHGHYVALVVYSMDFHWARWDTSPAGHWSHKPGQTPIKEVDSSGAKISDPARANWSPYKFCGYMTVLPSKDNIQ